MLPSLPQIADGKRYATDIDEQPLWPFIFEPHAIEHFAPPYAHDRLLLLHPAPKASLDDQLVDRAKAGDAVQLAALLVQCARSIPFGCKALFEAACHGRAECVKLLISAANPNDRYPLALSLAAFIGHADCVKLLISALLGLPLEPAALVSAAQAGHAECVRLLIPACDPMAKGSSALRRPAENGPD